MTERRESKFPFMRHATPSLSPVASLACSEEVACRISTYLKTLLRGSQRRARMLPIHIGSYVGHNHDHLEDITWRYTRIIELWRVHILHDNTWRSNVFQDTFREHLVRICLALAEWADARRNCYEHFNPVDQTHKIATLEKLINSLEQAWLTWSLCVEIHRQATDCSL
jgi:hypothetical protein